jgi:uncharacterized cupin superfamily protein
LSLDYPLVMRKINTNDIAEDSWSSPKAKLVGAGKEISEALRGGPLSTDLKERHPFDVEILRVPPGKSPYPYHTHSAQWEFYHIISGSGVVRHQSGITPIQAGDAFIFGPDQPHQLSNVSSASGEDLVVYVVADNPMGECSYYPDSKKWLVRSPERRLVRSESLEYYDGEE